MTLAQVISTIRQGRILRPWRILSEVECEPYSLNSSLSLIWIRGFAVARAVFNIFGRFDTDQGMPARRRYLIAAR